MYETLLCGFFRFYVLMFIYVGVGIKGIRIVILIGLIVSGFKEEGFFVKAWTIFGRIYKFFSSRRFRGARLGICCVRVVDFFIVYVYIILYFRAFSVLYFFLKLFVCFEVFAFVIIGSEFYFLEGFS